MASYLIFGVMLLAIGLVLRFLKVERNYLLGYRTFASMRSEESWTFANKTAGLHFMLIGAMSTLFGGGCYVYKWFTVEIVIFSTLALIVVTVVIIEWKLHLFNKTGGR